MKSSKQFWTGVKIYVDAYQFIKKNNMAWTFIVPILFTAFVLMSEIVLIDSLADYWGISIIDKSKMGISSGFVEFIADSVNFLFRIILFIFFAYFAAYIVIMLMSPILSYLSEKTDKILTGQEFKSNFIQTLKDSIKGIFISLRNIFMELILLFFMFILSSIPIVGFLAPVIVFLISAYFYGFSFMYFSMERHHLSINQSVRLVRKNKWLAIGNGSVFSLFLMIPILGVFLSMFTSIIAVVAATMSLYKAEVFEQKIGNRTLAN